MVAWLRLKHRILRRSPIGLLEKHTIDMVVDGRINTWFRTAVSYAMLATVCLFGGPLVNKIGIKWSLIVGAMTFPVRGASYYVNSKYGNQWVSTRTLPVASKSALIQSQVPHLWQFSQRHWYRLLVRRRSWVNLVSRSLGRPRQIPGPLDCVPQPRTTGRRRYQVSHSCPQGIRRYADCFPH